MPEGMVVNETALAAFAPVAKGLNLTQAQAQELVTLQTAQVQAAAQAQVEQWQSTQDEWREAAKADAEIGLTNFNQSIAHTATFLNKFGTPALVKLLDDTGVGNHVEFIRLFAAAGKAMGEAGITSGNPPGGSDLTAAQVLYPNQKP